MVYTPDSVNPECQQEIDRIVKTFKKYDKAHAGFVIGCHMYHVILDSLS